MRRRLLVTYVTLLSAILAALSFPLAVALAARNTQTVFIDRQRDTARFASLLVAALAANSSGALANLHDELTRYHELFHVEAMIVGVDDRLFLTRGEPWASFRSRQDLTGGLRENVELVLSGGQAGPVNVSWPWSDQPLTVMEPVQYDGNVIGVALTVSPTGPLHAATWRSWAVLASLGLGALLIGVVAAVPLSRWMLRPVRDLDEAVHALATGRFDDRVEIISGPPELRQLVLSFNGMADRVATLVQRQRDFVSYASHQLRTPLATLRLCVDTLRPAVRRAGTADFQMLSTEIERMSHLCDALLTYARVEVTAETAQLADAAEVCDARVAAWERVAERAGVRLTRTGATRAPINAAAQALDQSLDALLSNAVKFAGSGALIQVSIKTVSADWVEVDVIDTGPGMPPADLARAVEPFWRRATDQDVDGSGLGLTIADALVTASGGRLSLAAATPRGLHACIRLPATGSAQ